MAKPGYALPVTNWQVVPGGQQILPSAALGWSGGGEMPVAMENNTQGNKTVEPFFEVRGDLDARNGVILLDGRSGKIRFQLPAGAAVAALDSQLVAASCKSVTKFEPC